MSDILKFYDMKTKQKFETDRYRIEIRNNRRFAVALAPSGIESWRLVPLM